MNEKLHEKISALEDEINALKENPVLPTHSHTGFDMDKVKQTDLQERFERYCFTIPGTQAATATNYGVVFIAQKPCYVTTFQEVHQTLGTDAGAVTLDLEKLTSGQAPDGGSTILATALSLKTTINTVQTATITSYANRTLAKGDRLCLKDSGVLTAVANVTVFLEVAFI